MNSKQHPEHEPIAIVGLGCRFPGADGVREFWELLVNERNAIREIPADRFDVDAFHDPRPRTPGKLVARGGGFLDDVFGFDADYFRISPREAARLDPQQRLMLEVCASALDDAYLSRETLARHTAGVYIGAWTSDWECHEYSDRIHTDVYSMAGSGRCLLSGRISFAFDLRGPSLTVDTGCSASLIAVHLACQSLWLGESTLALAGGVNLVFDPKQGITFSQGGMLALDSQCKAFDARADGLVRSDGCGALVLMPLSAARDHGARIYALIRGSGASNDGFSNGLLATPSEAGQELAIRAAYRSARLSPGDVQYIEAHGTGTRAGDPVELRALQAVLGEQPRSAPCLIGSVKSNIGHTEGAAGVAGLIKTALALYHRTIPRSLHVEAPTPLFDWANASLRVAERTQAWPEGVARAGVSSFGISGTDVHVVLEELPPAAASKPAPAPEREELLVLSAASDTALRATAQRYCDLLRSDEAPRLHDVCYSASVGRRHQDRRLAVACGSRREVTEALEAFTRDEPHPALASDSCKAREPGAVFVCSGQGGQWDGMARELLEREPAFRAAIEACERALAQHAPWSLLHVLEDPATRWADQPIDVIQPAIFAIQVALASYFRAHGIQPALVVGHSMGEVAAAHIAGVLSLDDAALIITKRSQNLQALAGQGAMLSVELGFVACEQLLERYAGKLSIAASNSDHATVLSGDRGALHEIERDLRAQSVFCRELLVDAAAHSPQLDPLLPEFERALAGVQPLTAASTPICSTVTASLLPASAFDAGYWVRNQRQPVRFGAAIRALVRQGYPLFVELGPHPILLGAIQQIVRDEDQAGAVLGSLRRDEAQRRALLATLGRLHALGQPVDLRALFAADAKFVELPSYPFQRERFDEWPGAKDGAALATGEGKLGSALRSGLHPRTHHWQVQLAPAESSYLRDHVVSGSVMLPGAVYVDLALQAAEQVFGARAAVLEAVRFESALLLPGEAPTQLQLALELEQPELAAIRFYTADAAGSFTLHAEARARLLAAPEATPPALEPALVIERCSPFSPAAHVANAAQRKISFGPAFRALETLWTGERETLVKIELPQAVRYQKGANAFHPVLLDAGWQATASCIFANTPADAMYLPVGVEQVIRCGEASTQLWAHARFRTPPDAREVVADVTLFDLEGSAVLETRGLELRRVEGAHSRLEDALYGLRWIERARVKDPAPLTDQTWLVLADRKRDLAARIVAGLEARGARCVVAQALDPEDPRPLTALVALAASDPARPLAGVVDLWALDAVELAHATGAALREAQQLGVVSLAHLVQALHGMRPQLWVITSGAQPVAAGEPLAVAQAPVWALARVLRYEVSELRTRCLDLSAAAPEIELGALIDELCAGDGADQIALRDGRRYVLQLARAPEAALPSARPALARTPPEAFQLRTHAAGQLDNLIWHEVPRLPPGPGQVEIEVRAAGLNFIDVLKAFGIYPGMGDGPTAFGGECAGVISALGEGVTDLEIGQRVLAMADASFGRYTRTDAALVAALPESLGFAEAATIPAVFLTAHYALRVLGKLAPGERVLIHSAAGGVGLAAIQLARRAGAEIFATAGSAEKREFLRGLGIQHVFDSRGTDFGRQILAATGGQGVDVVLNSLTGRALRDSLALLRDDGRFLEIGKRDIYEDMQLGLLPFKRGLSFSHIDIGRLVRDKPALLGWMLHDLLEEVASGALQPLQYRTFALPDAAEAFRQMAQAKHIGKLVLTGFDAPDIAQHIERGEAAPLCSPDGTYLITGGLGGLGLLVARFLADQGARHLLLLGRSQPNADAQRALAALRSAGVETTVLACDVSSEPEVARVFEQLRAQQLPLRGVIHAAAVLDDGVTLQLTAERFERAMAPKLLGAFHLHQYSAGMPLDFFVMYSSAASALGSPGQGNYAAGNEFMDALAHHRRALGLPALSINWGPWRESGIAARPDRAGRLAARGMGSVSDAEGIALLERLMRGSAAQSVVLPQADFATWVQWYPAAASGMLEPLLGERKPAAATPAASKRAEIAAAPLGERHGLLQAYLVDVIRRVLRIPAGKPLATDQPLNRFGIDSLMAVELRNRIEADLSLALPVSKILLCTGLDKLASELLESLAIAPAADSGGVIEPARAATPLERMLGDRQAEGDELLDDLIDEDVRIPA